MTSGVYRIRNVVNDKCYLGSAGSRGIERRLKEHYRALIKGVHHSVKLQRAWDKYGESNFIFEILEECHADSCITREQFYLDTLLFANQNDGRFDELGYNVSRNAQNVMLGRHHSDATKARISASKRGNCGGNKHPMFGKFHSKEAKEKNREAHNKLSAEQVIEIKRLIGYMTQTAIAEKFNVHSSTISYIKSGRIWSHIGV